LVVLATLVGQYWLRDEKRTGGKRRERKREIRGVEMRERREEWREGKEEERRGEKE
jgi:hypothetical protein